MAVADVVQKYIRVGDVIANRYEIESLIGSGAYGAIFSAIDRTSFERVALKAVPPLHDGGRKTAIGRFQREMRVIASLRHPNVIALYDYGETDERIVYMVLEYIDGDTLDALVAREKLDIDDALDIILQLSRGLQSAHDQGVIHRDLKPQNVMVVKERGRYIGKVLDFGMAKVLSRLGDESIVQLTREGIAVGTPRYIAPEQARGRQVGPYSDIYALGLLSYELFTGAQAVKADTIESAILAHVSPEPLDLPEISEVPLPFRPILHRMIEKQVERRYQDAGELARDIEQLVHRISERSATILGESLDEETSPQSKHPTVVESDERTIVQERESRISRPGFSTAPQPVAESKRPEKKLSSFQSAEELELDLSRTPQRAKPSAPVKRRRTVFIREKIAANAGAIRMPITQNEWVEAIAALVLMPVAFTLLTAHLQTTGFIPRLFVGAIPAVFALVISFVMNSRSWSFSVWRLLLVSSVVAIAFAHFLGIDRLAVGLATQGAWYVAPISKVPLLSLVHTSIDAFCNAYVSLLAALFDSVGTEVRRALGSTAIP